MDALLETKIGVPPGRLRLVPRARLIDRLYDGLSYSLVLVSAPAGFGKTTLVSEWSRGAQSAAHTSWLSLDEGDNDPARFWDYFIAALRTFQPGVGDTTLAFLHSPQPVPAQSALIPLINELSAVSQDFVLVLDDYQFIRSPEIHAGLAFLLERIPPRMHLLIVTRADPPLPLAHFRGRGTILEIRADDLRFTIDEAASLLREVRGAELPLEHVSALRLRTEGWAVGLKMAALSMGPQEDSGRFIAAFTGSQRYIMDYLIEEVLQQQADEVQDFLLKTSVLEKLNAPLCDAVTGRTDSQTMLLDLERANLFLVPLDESRQWFRYEHLFAELLRHQLVRASGEATAVELHRRASGWHKGNGFLNQSIDHALAARDWESALDLLADVSERHKMTGEMVTLLGWFRAVPEEALLSRPPLCCDYGAALMFTGQLDAAEAVLNRLEPTIGADRPEQRARVVASRALIEALRGNIERSMELAQQSLPFLSPADLDVRASLSVNLGVVYWYRGLLKQAEPLYWEAYGAAKQAGHPFIAMVVLSFLANMSHWRGELSRAIELCEQAIELAPESPAVANARATLSDALYERNELESAMLHLNKGLELNRLQGHRPTQWSLLWGLMLVSTALGDEAGALLATEQVDQLIAGDTRPEARTHHLAHHVWLALSRGDLDEASRWGDRLLRFEGPVGFWDRLLLIRLLAIQGKKEEVSEQVKSFYESVEIELLSPEWKGWLIVIRIWQAVSASEPDEALSFLAEALAAAEPEGWIRSFVDEGLRLAPLLRKAVSRGISSEYAARLLTIIESEERRKADTGKSPRPSVLCALVTDRELEVLRLVAAGLSNRQIGGRLFISLGTVKAHLHNISEKLNATSRTGAVARARELKLL